MAMHNALWEIIRQTDTVSKGILLTMAGMSIGCWTLALYKWTLLHVKLREIKQAKTLFRNIHTFEEFISRAGMLRGTFIGSLIESYLVDFKLMIKSYETVKSSLTTNDWQALNDQINQALDEALQQEEQLLPIFSTSAQAAPLIGLFGTVWGLIHAFLAIGQQKSADIAAVAPGIAEALITTLGGLVVAIPALVLFNYLQNKTRLFEAQLVQLTEQCRWILKQVTVTKDTAEGNFITISKDKIQEKLA